MISNINNKDVDDEKWKKFFIEKWENKYLC